MTSDQIAFLLVLAAFAAAIAIGALLEHLGLCCCTCARTRYSRHGGHR